MSVFIGSKAPGLFILDTFYSVFVRNNFQINLMDFPRPRVSEISCFSSPGYSFGEHYLLVRKDLAKGNILSIVERLGMKPYWYGLIM
uniref:Uncharacterized protein n=1 Tax=Megaselia scalaris TaxID=36166 RepID=T1H4R2_MEGSC